MKVVVPLALIIALALPSCARSSGMSRSERAYAKYVRASKAGREERQMKVRRTQQQIPQQPASDPVETISTEGGPSDG